MSKVQFEQRELKIRKNVISNFVIAKINATRMVVQAIHALTTDQTIHNRILSKVCCNVFTCGIGITCIKQKLKRISLDFHLESEIILKDCKFMRVYSKQCVHRYVWHCQKFSCNYFPCDHRDGTGILDYGGTIIISRGSTINHLEEAGRGFSPFQFFLASLPFHFFLGEPNVVRLIIRTSCFNFFHGNLPNNLFLRFLPPPPR